MADGFSVLIPTRLSLFIIKTVLNREWFQIKNEFGWSSFRLPVRDISKSIKSAGVYCPGSFVKTELKEEHPLTLGMPSSTGVFFRGTPVFTTSIPRFDMDRRVIAKFPDEEILMSDYCEKPEKLADKTVMVWLQKGKGQLVLYGFNPQFRASTQGSYKLLFNGLLLEKIK
ncbi:MAG: hypothetical protein ABIJ04_05060 [Bacteroidota bacterium]